MKEPKCKICSGRHYATFCFQAPRKKIEVKRPIQREIQKPIRRTKIKVHSSSIRSRLVKEADRVFSIYIRKSNSINGVVRCVTCGSQDKWQNMDNGHYLSRRYMQIRWDEMNVGCQCHHCNRDMGGNLVRYRMYLIKKYGYDPTDVLKSKVKTRGKVQLSDIEHIITKYKKKIDML